MRWGGDNPEDMVMGDPSSETFCPQVDRGSCSRLIKATRRILAIENLLKSWCDLTTLISKEYGTDIRIHRAFKDTQLGMEANLCEESGRSQKG